jgi:MYXO-CTERM domain-containing protein
LHIRHRLRFVRVHSAALFTILLSSLTAQAAVGPRDLAGWSGVDSLAPGAVVIPRYVSDPVLTGAGDGTMDYPTIAQPIYDWATKTVKVPLETWTVTALDATNWTVVGSVSGPQAQAMTANPYTTPSGISFNINAGATPFAAGDAFVFKITDSIDATTAKVAQSFTVSDDGFVLLKYNQTPEWNFPVNFYGTTLTNHTLVIRDNGYLSVYQSNANDQYGYLPTMSNSEPLPSRKVFSSEGNRPGEILPFWDALLPKATSKIWVAQNGRPGSRTLTIEWSDFGRKDDPTASYTFEVVFFEGSPRIRFHYLNMVNGTKTSADGSTATVGIQPRLTNFYTANQYGFHKTGLISNGLCVELGQDSDGDRLPDGIEAQYGTDSGNQFTDAGAPPISDGAQIRAGLNPLDPADNASMSADTDSDALLDVEEAFIGTDPAKPDTDGDGINDGIELTVARTTDPLKADTDGDGLKDGQEDANGNGITDAGETDPTLYDTDGDGMSDALEALATTDPLDPAKSRWTGPAGVANYAYNIASTLDSKGNLHIAAYSRNSNNNQTADDLFVALFKPDGTGAYSLAVASTVISAHTGHDDRMPTIVTLPGTGAIDRTFVLNGDPVGVAFLTELDFNQAALDGTASTSAALVVASKQLALPLGVQHPHARASKDGNIHLVFLGSNPSAKGGTQFTDTRTDRGVYYTKLSPAGDVLVAPVELYVKSPPNHPHTHPRVDVDAQGNLHGVFRAGSCAWSSGPTDCSLYYFKIGPMGNVEVPATKLALDGMGGIDKAPDLAISPNGNVNIVYASIAPTVSMGSKKQDFGAPNYGRPVYLHVISTVNNNIKVLINQKIIMSEAPTPASRTGTPRINVWHTPTIATDGGGNLHVLAAEDRNTTQGYYEIFDPSGAPVLGPILVPDSSSWSIRTLRVKGTRTFMTYNDNNNNGSVRSFDFSGLGVDLTGDHQIPPQVSTMTVTAAMPNQTQPGAALQVTITGTGFSPSTTADIGGTALTNVVIWSDKQLSGDFDPGSLAIGEYDIKVANADGAMATLAKGFRVGNPAPTMLSIAPSAIQVGTTPVILIAGTGFITGATVTVGGTAASDATVLSSGAVQFTAPAGLALGKLDVTVTNPDTQAATLTGGLEVTMTGAGSTPDKKSGCGCYIGGAPDGGNLGGLLLLAIGAGLFFIRRRRVG